MKKYLGLLLIVTLLFVGCSDFLEENPLSIDATETAFETEQGLEEMVAGAYVPLRCWYGIENGWDFTESGTDIYTFGADTRSPAFASYSSTLAQEEQGRAGAIWSELYAGVQTCNVILANIRNAKVDDPSIRTIREGEIRFLRAHYLWQIVETWGDVVLDTTVTTSPSHYAYRSPVEDFYEVIFSDLNLALNLVALSESPGRVTKPVVEAFLARMHLTRGNNIEAKLHADNVISNYGFELEPDWSKLWELNVISSEMVWPIMWSNNEITRLAAFRDFTDFNTETGEYELYDRDGGINQRDGGQQGMVTWQMRYEEIHKGGMQRTAELGRGFMRWMPTRFLIELFDETVDERFFGSFESTWICNSNSSTLHAKWGDYVIIDGDSVAVDPALIGTQRFTIGDTAIVLSKNPIAQADKAKGTKNAQGKHYFNIEKGHLTIDIDDMYQTNDDGTYAARDIYFPMYKKYYDPTYTDMAVKVFSQRDIYAIRLSEMYLISAEASLDNGDPYNRLLELANARSFDGDGAALLASYGVNSGADVDLDFILDERARELATEGLRWFDLKRTGKLVERVKLHNPDAALNIEEYHNLRFIPQIQLDAVYNKEDFKQNPGY